MNPNLPNPKDIIVKVLTIIDYQNDKDAFADKFLNLSLQQAFVDLIASLTPDKQEEIKKELALQTTPEGVQAVTQKYFTPQDYFLKMQQSSQKFFQDYIASITPTLTDIQKQNLNDYLISLATEYKDEIAKLQNPQTS